MLECTAAVVYELVEILQMCQTLYLTFFQCSFNQYHLNRIVSAE